MSQAGESLGLAFQAVDDLLDVARSSQELGKDAKHDQACPARSPGSVTWEKKARKLASGHTDRATRFVREIGGENAFLLELIAHMLAPPHVMSDERRLFSRDWKERLSLSRASGKGFAAPEENSLGLSMNGY